MNRKVPKDHREVKLDIDYWAWEGRGVHEIISEVQERVADLREPVAVFSWGDLLISGFVPMTEVEKEVAKRRRAASRKANAARQAKREAEERALLEKLKAKYE